MLPHNIKVMVLLFAVSAGCGSSDAHLSPQIKKTRERLVLSSEPKDILGILEVREAGVPEGEFALLGRIGGVAQPWSPGEAAFIMSDPVVEVANDHVCSGDCAFCKKKKEKQPDPWAIVQFADETGNVLPIDARKLLDVEESQTVVVHGHASVDSIGNLVMSARGIYIRR